MKTREERLLAKILLELEEGFDVPEAEVTEDYYCGWNDAIKAVRLNLFETLLTRLFNTPAGERQVH
ncbi:MAG: hypothetical protein U9Q07_12180 [Planctomycetota bacterium]|nr:hypothetical protein [Planctomycetota bacterium]